MAIGNSKPPSHNYNNSFSSAITFPLFFFFFFLATADSSPSEVTPNPWPHQFHALLFINYSGSLEFTDLWYDWTKGLNFLIIRHQLRSYAVHDVEWNNGTTFVFHSDGGAYCRSRQLEVGILRPNWAQGGNYLGQMEKDGFLCNVWEKAHGFIFYYEDVVSKLPIYWQFHTGRAVHVMTFEVGVVAKEDDWQAPSFCFQNAYNLTDVTAPNSAVKRI